MSASVSVYVPVYKVKADYIVQQGRNWSPFEHMVLWQLAQKRATSLELAEQAGVPVRLVVECLIELMNAGWVDVRTGGNAVSFEATLRGRKAAELISLPRATRSLKRRTTLCMDRLAMGFFEPEDLTLIHEESLPKNAVVLRPRVFKLTMTPAGSLDRLYMLEDETFEEWVDYRITSQRFYALLTIVGENVQGLPPYAPPELSDAILEEVSTGQEQVEAPEVVAKPSSLKTGDGYCLTEVHPDDLVLGGPEHLAAVQHVFKEANSFVLLHTCFIHPDAVRKLMPAIEAAAKRDVDIDLLWGQRNDRLQGWAIKAFLDVKMIFDKLPPALRRRIRFADRETGSHAKVILADSGPNATFEAYVGSCNWLSSRYESIEFSLRVREPWAIGSIATALAHLRVPSSGRWSPDIYRLVELRSACRRLGRRENGSHQLAMVIDREHLAAVREARDSAKETIVAVCDLLGPAGETSVFVPARTAAEAGAQVHLCYNTLAQTLSVEERDRFASDLVQHGIALETCNQLHAKFMTWDQDALLVTSFNWLAATLDPWKPRGSEIGMLVKGPGLVPIVLDRFRKLTNLELAHKSQVGQLAHGPA